MAERQLPEGFQDLEPFLSWSLATDRERIIKRKTSLMPEIVAFYEAVLPRMDAILSHLEQFPAEQEGSQIPADVQRLFFLALSLAKIAPAVELYGYPVPEGLDALRLENVNIYPEKGNG